MAAHLNQAPKPPVELNPGLPAALNEIILMAIAKEPAKRFQTADAFANALTTVPASSAVAPTVPRTPIGGPTGGSRGARPASGKLSRTSPPAAPIAATLPAAPTMPASHGLDTMPATPAALRQPAHRGRNRRASNAGPMPPPQQSGGHRGLYMTLGALVVLVGLVFAGIYVPRISKTHAKAPDTSASQPARDTASRARSSQHNRRLQMLRPAAHPLGVRPHRRPHRATTASVDNSGDAMESSAACSR